MPNDAAFESRAAQIDRELETLVLDYTTAPNKKILEDIYYLTQERATSYGKTRRLRSVWNPNVTRRSFRIRMAPFKS